MEQGLRVFDGPKVRRLRCCRAGSRLRALLRSRAPRTGTGHTAGNRLGTVLRGWAPAPCPGAVHRAPGPCTVHRAGSRAEPCHPPVPAGLCAPRGRRGAGTPAGHGLGGGKSLGGSPTAFWFCFVLFSSSFSFNLLSTQFCYS